MFCAYVCEKKRLKRDKRKGGIKEEEEEERDRDRNRDT